METTTSLTSPEKANALSDAWIEKLFSRFSAMYGRKFADMWIDCNLSEVKALWSEELAGYTGEEIRQGLEACRTKDWPPTLPEFVKLCRPEPNDERRYLEAKVKHDIAIGLLPNAVPELRKELPPPGKSSIPKAEAEKRIARMAAGIGHQKDHKDWARKIIANPKMYPSISLKFARRALDC